MECENYQNKIQEYFDNDLKKNDEPLLFMHLSQCNECRNFFKSMNLISNNIEIEKSNFPAELDQKIFSKISEQKKPKNYFTLKTNYPAYLGYGIAIFTFVFLIFFSNTNSKLKNEIEYSKNLIKQKEKEIILMQNALNEITVKSNFGNEIIVTTSL